jgi:hypothetical protein
MWRRWASSMTGTSIEPGCALFPSEIIYRFAFGSFGVHFSCDFNEFFFAVGVASFRFDVEGFAEHLQGVGVGVQGSSDGGGDDLFWIVVG